MDTAYPYQTERVGPLRKEREPAAYRMIPDTNGNRYHFFCEASGALACTTNPTRAKSPDEELWIAWELEGRAQFNRCQKCGRWVMDVMFNADVLQCVDCAPWEDVPKFCAQCGRGVSPEDVFCRKCGARLRYREVDTDDKGTT